MKSDIHDSMSRIRNCLSKIWNKQFLIFLLFLFLSASFWLFQTLNETYEQDYLVPLKIENQPAGVIITSELPEHLNITIRDKGVTLLNYKYGEGIPYIGIDFSQYANSTGHIRILTQTLHKKIGKSLAPGSVILSAKPDTIDFYYNHGLHKKVPVRIKGNARIQSGYALTGTTLAIDSVTVYASSQILETIDAAYIQPNYLEELTSTTTIKLPFQTVKGTKFVPDSAEVTLQIDRLVEKKVTVPVTTENFPANLNLITIPGDVEISFQVSMDQYREITSDMFAVTAHYEDLPKSANARCPLRLKKAPKGITRIRISPNEVDYVIEEITAQ